MTRGASGPIVTLGESMGLLRQERPGPLHAQRQLGFGFGGAESNVAIAASRLGAPAEWIGRLGEDSVGDLIERELRAEGVTPRVVRDPDAATGLMLKERPIPDTSRVVYYRRSSAGSRLRPEDVPAGAIERAALLHVTGITPALSASASATVDAAVARARAAGVPVSLDLNYRSALWSEREAAERLRALVAAADIVFAGDDEAAMLVGARSAPELAAALAELGPAEVVVKLGARGCFARIDGTAHERAAAPVRVVDTVGAGDAFVGAYLAERAAGAPVPRRLDTAILAGAFACLHPGDWEGLPTRRDLEFWRRADPVQR
ncbi:sugar kinase [Leucobacter allii]|uniref:sugar kinase n=1 Tax=Leucobacter allii TaxID=2932247 RepID=UPI001FD352E4|nr:sugar kinase [Leucobacter allii]UOR02557.1 sugar kinase [Leucobacter allii]